MNEYLPLILALLGIALCFFGYKIQKAVIVIGMFYIGFTLANIFLGKLFDDKTIFLIVKIVCGLLLAGGGFKLQRLALFIIVAYYSYQIIAPISLSFLPKTDYDLYIRIGISLVIGMISIRFIKPIMILVSSYYGANLVKVNLITALKMFIPTITISGTYLTVIFWALFILGAFVQGKTN